ncbi:MAG: phosphoribosylglycinamide formyltransferase [Saprospiraceae bacterium]|nr:phosphoribosylglycinamide formyltransferase [Saprospiraceae bacterium]
MKHIVVFASGSGTNFQSLIDAIEAGHIPARIRALVTNNSEAGALQRARRHGIETAVLTPDEFENRQAYEQHLLDKLKLWETDLIVLAGYIRKIPASVIQAYEGRMVNIHPSLLPKYGGKGFYGIKVHRAVIENGETQTGCTVHLVTEEYDKGPIIAQETVPVHPTDDAETLAKRVLKEEHKLLPRVVGELIENLNQKENS